MNVPDLSQAADAGVHDWHGSPDALKSAAGAAKLRFCSIDLHGVVSKTDLMAALAKGLKLPEHFGSNWDALADSLEDSDWLGPHGIVAVMKHSARIPQGARGRLGNADGHLQRSGGVLARRAQTVLGLRRLIVRSRGFCASAPD